MAKYDLFIGNKNYSSWSLRPWVLMTERAIAFNERLEHFGGDNWKTFRAFSPTGRVPVLHDGDTVVWETPAIMEYLAERHDGVWPADAAARAWARCAASEMHAGFNTLRDRCTMNIGVRIRIDDMSDRLRRDIDRVSELWSEGLSRFGGPFLAGAAFTAVDAFFAPVAFRIQTYGLVLDDAPAAYAARLLNRPSMQAWEAAALAETFRDPAHEAELKQMGTLLEDRRA
ncbi:MAG: glutathione S-transferase family protein [Variibacter sp.]